LVDCNHQIGSSFQRTRTRLNFLTKLAQPIRENCVTFRLGGDEFGILLPSLELSEARTISERNRTTVEEFFLSEMITSLNVGASIGVAMMDGF
jgi:GGDEF domain-containing protein